MSDFIQNHTISNTKYLKENSTSQIDFEVPIGPTKVKAGPHLVSFQKLVPVKLVKNFIELLKPITVKKGEKISMEKATVFRVLDHKLDEKQSRVKAIWYNRTPLSDLYTNYIASKKLINSFIKSAILNLRNHISCMTFVSYQVQKITRAVLDHIKE
jgi:hypothetical protein